MLFRSRERYCPKCVESKVQLVDLGCKKIKASSVLPDFGSAWLESGNISGVTSVSERNYDPLGYPNTCRLPTEFPVGEDEMETRCLTCDTVLTEAEADMGKCPCGSVDLYTTFIGKEEVTREEDDVEKDEDEKAYDKWFNRDILTKKENLLAQGYIERNKARVKNKLLRRSS